MILVISHYYLLCPYYVPCTIAGTEDLAGNKKKLLSLMELSLEDNKKEE